ncbi:anthranilate synthase / indole-3-glycerol phosphate synthase [Marasmius tenuissimus]|uniref:Multifunctional tryptophan biosynthesis protein n=1 Tax=Marasmius tenuissimus TaxID=585030 RepID=A0ABR3AGX9_9AGAR|nr:anthranilate synthase / indole-3-glycerol phosphate synthase [Marasmius tenuissimus]
MSTSLPTALAGELDVLMIDNFDSFTWNLYQQLCLAGAEVTVIRNDAIDPSLFPQLKIKSLVISPGPGNPQEDSGISKDAIQYFEGKVPVLGVCMGLECLVDLHGGQIGYAGEIMHGKTSRIKHDNRGCFKGVPQGIESIRYHSLSASLTTLPPDLAITAVTEESNVIMGVRHRKYTVEAVQYHPESILSDGGDELIRNFLTLRGGLWEDNPESRVLDNNLPPFHVDPAAPKLKNSRVPSILGKIQTQRLADVAQAQKTPGATLADLQTLLSLNIAPPQIPLLPRLERNSSRLALLAEIKRASPSSGLISVATSPASQALTYALAGANVISVLTEPKWFLGSLQDMLHARMAVASLPDRPAILRKDFILSRYQVLESRVWGADTILLIVSMLPEKLLRDLYEYSLELGMEPLVEVNNAKEMELALSLPAKVIGVNNRNLHDFEVDMSITSRLVEMTKDKGVVLCALSGISTPEDVKKYASEGVSGVLIGESLMKAPDPAAFIHELFSLPDPAPPSCHWSSGPPLVKICGIRGKEEALAIAKAGADMIGLLFVKKSSRYVDFDTAREISLAVRATRPTPSSPFSLDDESLNAPWFTSHATRLSSTITRPLLVGVFQDAPLPTILHAVSHCQLDIVQLHGREPVEMANQIPVPVIRVCHVTGNASDLSGITRPGLHEFVLLDSIRNDGSGITGGSGKVVDLALARRIVDAGELVVDPALYKADVQDENGTDEPPVTVNGEEDRQNANGHAKEATQVSSVPSKYPLPIILAGGLKPENIADAIAQVQPWAVDVSGGVETADGKAKDLEKVRAFIDSVKKL